MFTLTECVLVVDDMEPQIDVLVETLAVNYNVSVCLDGETALHAVAGQYTGSYPAGHHDA